MMGKKVRHAFAASTRQIRLRPDEGLVPHPDERGLRTRDRSGQKLQDIIDPTTGFCTGVRGPMESDGTTVRMAAPTSGGGTPLPERDPDTGLWWVGNDRLVIRTTDTPHGPLVRTRIIKAGTPDFDPDMPTHQKISKTPKPRVQKSVQPAGQDRPKRGPRYTDREIRDYLKTKFGYTGPLTRVIRTAAISALVKSATVAEYSKDLRSDPKNPKTSG
jgi:hypothetical protein